MPNIIDDRTANLNLPLPAISNPLSVDNGRLRDALAAIDTAVFGRPLAADVTTQINAAVAALIGGAPGALDTLKELADAINDDASFAATVTNALAAKAPLASPTFTGTPTVNGTALATTNKSTPIYLPTLASIDECRILTGTYAGGYLVAPAGHLNVYFAALGLLGVVEKRPTETKAFLDMVFANLVKASDGTRGSYTVYDVQGIQGTPSLKDPDSNDSYASVLNTLAYQYALASGDWAWYSANVTMLKNLAYFNIVVPLKPAGAAGAGMARTFQTSAWGPYYGICLTEDNCEVYEGMDALSKGCAAIGATADATYYANVRDGLGAAINNVNYGVWDQVNNRWFTSDQRPAFAGTFYADAVTQVFPEVYNVSSGDAATDRQRYDFGWVSLNAAAPQWESVKYDDFPWMILAYAAELRGSFDQAEQKMGSVRRINTRAQFTVNEAGWQGRVEKLASLRGYVPPTKAAVGLGSVDNTSDVNKPVSTAQQAAIATAQASLTATSTTSQAVGLGAKSITIELNKSLAVGQPISVASTASPANADYGTVTAYSPSTGALSYTAKSITGSGTFAAWTIGVTGVAAQPASGFRNRIHNGNFNVNQRAVSSTVTLAAGVYGHDRWKAGASGCTYTFAASGGITTLTISAGSLQQIIPGSDLQTGTHVLSWQGTAQGTIAGGSYGASGITGAATGGTNLTVEFNAGTISRVQVEPGTVATNFEYRPVGTELSFCQRFLPVFGGTGQLKQGFAYSTSQLWISYDLPVPTNTAPTGVTISANADFRLYEANNTTHLVSNLAFSLASTTEGRLLWGGADTPFTVGVGGALGSISSLAKIIFTGCEL